MNMIIIFYICILIDLFFIQLLLYLNFRRLDLIQDLALDLALDQLRAQVRSKSQELLSKLQDIKNQNFKCPPTRDEHPADEYPADEQHPFFEPKINRDKE